MGPRKLAGPVDPSLTSSINESPLHTAEDAGDLPSHGDVLHRNERVAHWYEAFSGSMTRWLSRQFRLQSSDMADVVQEVYARLLHYSDGVLIQYPQSYLFRIAANVVNEMKERCRNKLPHSDEGLEVIPIEIHDEPESVVERSLVVEEVRAALLRLPSRQRQILLLHVRQGLTYRQIANKVKVTPRIVRRDISHAYAQLRVDLASSDASSPASKSAKTQSSV